MAGSVDSSVRQKSLPKKVEPVVDKGRVRSEGGLSKGVGLDRAPDIEALVQESLQSSYGNAIVQAALDGGTVEGLGEVIAGEIAASAAGMGALSDVGSGMMASGNAALAKAVKATRATSMSKADALNTLRGGGGQHLPAGIRAQMEAAFGRSFMGVRVHTETGEAAAALGAEAVAMGSHLHFAEGMYSPGSTAGQAVIAHELTHVVQAEEGRLPGVGGVSNTSMSAEQEAYANEVLMTGPSLNVDGTSASLMASSVDTSISADAFGSMGAGLGSMSAGLGSMSTGGMSMAPVLGSMAEVSASTPMEASTSAPAMLRESDDIDKEESDTEASARHEIAMGLKKGFSRAIDMSQGTQTVNVAKEGTGRKDGVFTGPSPNGHLAVDEYNKVMREIGPDGDAKASGADEFLTDSAENTKTENDGHVHLDDSPKLGATPETTATAPGGDPVMGGPTGGMVAGADKAGMEGSLAEEEQKLPPGQSQKQEEELAEAEAEPLDFSDLFEGGRVEKLTPAEETKLTAEELSDYRAKLGVAQKGGVN